MNQEASADDGQPASLASPARRWIAWDACVLALPLLAALPLLILQANGLWEQLPWRFFPLTLVAVGIFAFVAWQSNDPVTHGRRAAAVGVLAIGSVLLLFAIWNVDPWTAHLACTTCFLAWALGRLGASTWHRAAAWGCVLLTTLPLPFGLDHWLHMRLIAKSAQYSALLLDVFGIPHFFSGGQIQLREFSVDVLACSNNLASIFALWSFAVVWSVLRNRGLLHGLVLIFSAGVWYILANTLLLFGIAYGWQTSQWDLSGNPELAWWTAAMTLVCVSCLAMTDQLLKTLLRPSPLSDPEFMPVFAMLNTLLCWPRDPLEELGADYEAGESDFEEEDEEEINEPILAAGEPARRPSATAVAEPVVAEPVVAEPVAAEPVAAESVAEEPVAEVIDENADVPSRQAQAANDRTVRRALVALSLLIAASGIAPWAALMNGQLLAKRGLSEKSVQPLTLEINEATFPKQWNDWNLIGFEQPSANATRWLFQWKGQAVTAALQPREAWDGTPVAINAGWRIDSVQLMRAPRPAANWPWAFCEMKNELGGTAYAFHSGLDALAEPIEDFQEAQLAVNPNMLSLLSGRAEPPKWTYQFQMTCESGRALTSAELQELQEAFLHFRNQLLAQASSL